MSIAAATVSKVHAALAAVAERFAADGVRWAVLRVPASGLAVPQGDVDILLHPDDRQRCAAALSRLGFQRIRESPHDSHYVRYCDETDVWLWLHLVSALSFGLTALPLDGEHGALTDVSYDDQAIPHVRPDPAFWLLLWHCLSSKGHVAPHHRTALVGLRPDADPAGNWARMFAAGCGDSRIPDRLVTGILREDWPSVEAQAPWLADARQPPCAAHRVLSRIVRGGRILLAVIASRRARGFSVAVIGPDGAGKTTLVDGIRATVPLPTRTVYMGLTGGALKHVHRLHVPGVTFALGTLVIWSRYIRGQVYRARGFLVLFERYVYDAVAPHPRHLNGAQRFARAVSGHLCPSPDMVILLDAPGPLMYRRKGEYDGRTLEGWRIQFLSLKQRLPRLEVIDATQTIERVRVEAVARIWKRYADRLERQPRRGAPMGRHVKASAHRHSTSAALVLTWLVFAAYAFLHSPLRDLAAHFAGRPGHLSYFSWLGALTAPAAANGAVALLAMVAASGAAACIAARFPGPAFERPIVFAVSAFAFIVVPAAMIGELGALAGSAPLRPPLGPLRVANPASVTVAWHVAGGWRPRIHLPRVANRPSRAVLMMGALAAVLLGGSVFVALTRPPTGFDALAYHAPMAVYLWRDGNLVDFLDRAPRAFAMALPGAAELWFGLLLMAGGERLANVGQLPFAALGTVAIYAACRRLRVPPRAAMLAGLSFLVVPMVAVQAGMQLNDLVATGLLTAAAALVIGAPKCWAPSRLLAVGLALGMAAATKLAVLPALAAFVLFTGAAMLSDRTARRHTLRMGGAMALGFAVAVGPWWIRNAAMYTNPTYPTALPLLSPSASVGIVVDVGRVDDRFVPSPVLWPLYPLLEGHSEQSGFGSLLLITAVPGVIGAFLRHRRRALLLFCAVTTCTLAAWAFFTAHEPRHLLLIPTLGLVFAPFALLLVPRPQRSSVVLLWLVAAAFSVLVTFDQAILPRFREPMNRPDFYDDVWGVDPIVAADRKIDPLLYNMGYAPLSYAADYPLLGPSRERRLFTVGPDESTRDLVALMRRFGISYAYVPASPANDGAVRTKYDSATFELQHDSTVREGDRAGMHRYLFRLREGEARGQGDQPPRSGDRAGVAQK